MSCSCRKFQIGKTVLFRRGKRTPGCIQKPALGFVDLRLVCDPEQTDRAKFLPKFRGKKIVAAPDHETGNVLQEDQGNSALRAKLASAMVRDVADRPPGDALIEATARRIAEVRASPEASVTQATLDDKLPVRATSGYRCRCSSPESRLNWSRTFIFVARERGDVIKIS